ncbi:MAG: hypothetical protein AAFV88_06790 [Planctomycetota bacterium]
MLILNRLNRRTAFVLVAPLCFLLTSTIAQAAITIEFVNTRILSGASGSIDVLIRGTDSESLQGFSGRFAIQRVGGLGVLEFSDPQSRDETTFESSNLSYVFLNDSNGFSTTSTIPSELIQTDLGTTPVVLGADPFLMARLDFQHITPTAVDATYEIRLVEDPGQTIFFDTAFAPHAIDDTAFSTRGIVEVTAIPEPSFAMLGLLTSSGLVLRRRRRPLCLGK